MDRLTIHLAGHGPQNRDDSWHQVKKHSFGCYPYFFPDYALNFIKVLQNI